MFFVGLILAGMLFSGIVFRRTGEGFVFGLLILPGLLTAICSVIGFLITFMAAEIFAFGTPGQALNYGALGFFGGLASAVVGFIIRSVSR